MAITAKFQADFSSFIQAIDKAEIALVDFGKGASSVETKLNKMTDNFSGRKLIQEAALMTIAVEKAGGVSNLTAKELATLSVKANEAAEKMAKIGAGSAPGLEKLRADIAAVGVASKDTATTTDGLGASFGKFVAGLVTAQAIVAGIKGAFNAFTGEISSSIKAAGDAEKAHVQLVAALRAQGTAVPSVISAFQGYATALQKTTIYQDDAVESAAALLVTIGNVMPRDMEKALKATTNLASGLGIDLETAARTVAKAAEGNTTALRKVGVVMDETKGKTHEFGEVLDAITAKFGGQAEAIAGTYQGRLAQLGNTWNNVEESIGRVITQNATVLKAFDLINQAIDQNTGELKDNATATNLVSEAVILTVKGFSLFVSALDLAQTGGAAFIIGLRDIAQALGNVGVFALEAARATAFFSGDSTGFNKASHAVDALKDAVKELGDRNAATTTRSVAFGMALDTIGAKADALVKDLEKTRGKTVELKDVTDGASNAWDRHTVAVGKSTGAISKFDEAMSELNAAGEGWRGTLDGIDGTVVESIKFYLAAGVAADKLATAFGLTAVQVKAVESSMKAETNAAKNVLEIHNKIEAGLFGLQTAIGHVDEAELRWLRTQTSVNDALKKVEQSIPSAVAGFYSMADSLEKVGQKSTEIDELKLKLKEVDEEQKRANERWAHTADILEGVADALGEIGTKWADLAAEALNDAASIGDAFEKGIANGIIKSVQVGIKWIKKLFHDVEEEVNPVREAFVQLNGGLDTLNKKAHDAGMTLNALLNAKTPEQYQKAIDDLNAAFERFDKWIDESNSDLGGLLKSFQDVAGKLPKTLDPMIQKLIDMGRLTGENADLIKAMSSTTEVDFKKMSEVAGKYGIDLAKLGPAFQSARIHDAAKTIINDFDLLARNGADVDAVLAGMKKPINDLVIDSLKFGVAIPENMKPWIAQLIKTGQLLDENGQAITDISQIKFAAPIVTEFDKLIKKIQDLIDALLGPLPAAIKGIPSPDPVRIPIEYDYPGGRFHGENEYASMGGRVTSSGVQYMASGGPVLRMTPRGIDTQPIMAAVGEGIVSRKGMSILGDSGLSALNKGQAPIQAEPVERDAVPSGDLHVNFIMDGTVVKKAIIKDFRNNKGGEKSDLLAALGLPVTTWNAA